MYYVQRKVRVVSREESRGLVLDDLSLENRQYDKLQWWSVESPTTFCSLYIFETFNLPESEN